MTQREPQWEAAVMNQDEIRTELNTEHIRNCVEELTENTVPYLRGQALRNAKAAHEKLGAIIQSIMQETAA